MAKSNIEKQIDGLDEEFNALEERLNRLTDAKAKEIQGLTELVNEKSATVEVLKTQIDALEHGEETDPEKVKEILTQRLDVEKELETAEKELEIVSDKLKKATESKEYLSVDESADIRNKIESYLKQTKELQKELCVPDVADIRRAGENVVTAAHRANNAIRVAAKLNPKASKNWVLNPYQSYEQARPFIESTKAFDPADQWWYK